MANTRSHYQQLAARADSAICLAVRMTEGSASTVAGRPGSHQGCHQRDGWARLPSVIVRVNSRLRGGRPRPTITNECRRFILMERCRPILR